MGDLKKGDMVMLKKGVVFEERTLGVVEYSRSDGYEVWVGGSLSVICGDYHSLEDSVDEVVRRKQNFNL